MRAWSGIIFVAASVLTPVSADAGPEAHRAGLKMCAAFAQHYGDSYVKTAALPEAEREQAFTALKEQQATKRMQDASRGVNEVEGFYVSVEHFVQRTVMTLAIEEPLLSLAGAQGRLYDQCGEQVRGLLDLPGK